MGSISLADDRRPSARHFVQSEKEDQETAADQQSRLEHLRPSHRTHPAVDGKGARENCQAPDTCHQRNTEHFLQQERAGENHASQIDEYVTDDADDGVHAAHGSVVAEFQELRHRHDPVTQVDRQEHPDQQAVTDEIEPFPVRNGHAVAVGVAHHADQLLGA